MKKILGVLILSLLVSGVAYAKKIHDANENGILMTECVFAKGKCHRIAILAPGIAPLVLSSSALIFLFVFQSFLTAL